MRAMQKHIALLTLLVPMFALGCSGSAGPSKEGRAMLLASEPADAMDVVDLKSALLTGTVTGGEVAMVGRVGGGQAETWDTDQAAFLVRDLNLEVASHDHAGNHDNCKFCQAEQEQLQESMALVRMVDQQGDVIPQDARELLGLTENHIVVLQGQGMVEDGTFVFDAAKIYIRR